MRWFARIASAPTTPPYVRVSRRNRDVSGSNAYRSPCDAITTPRPIAVRYGARSCSTRRRHAAPLGVSSHVCSAGCSSDASAHLPKSPVPAVIKGASTPSGWLVFASATASSHAASRCVGSAASASLQRAATVGQSFLFSALRAALKAGCPARLRLAKPESCASPSGCAGISTTAASLPGTASFAGTGGGGVTVLWPHATSATISAIRTAIYRLYHIIPPY